MNSNSRKELAQAILDVRYGRLGLEGLRLHAARYESSTARAFVRASGRAYPLKTVVLNGIITGDVLIDVNLHGGLSILGHVEGNVTISSEIAGGLSITGAVDGDVTLQGSVGRNVSIGGDARVSGSVTIAGSVGGSTFISGRASVTGDLKLARSASVGGDVSVKGSARVDGDLVVRVPATVGGRISVHGSGHVGGNVRVSGAVGGDLYVAGTVGRSLMLDSSASVGGTIYVPGSISEDVLLRRNTSVAKQLTVTGSVGGGLTASGRVGGDLALLGRIGGHVLILGQVDGSLDVAGSFGGAIAIADARVQKRVSLSPERSNTPVTLASVAGSRFDDSVFVGDGIDISSCDFRRCPDLDRFELVGVDLFPSGNWALANPPATLNRPPSAIPANEIASIYRRLRSNLEQSNNRPAAGPFYEGEMTARRAASSWRSADWWTISMYWAMSGYGLRAKRAFSWFIVIALIGTAMFMLNGFDLDPSEGVLEASWAAGFTFTVRSMVSFFSPPEADLGVAGEWVQIMLRVLGPLLIAQVVLAVRERVAR